jgi:ferredoxin
MFQVTHHRAKCIGCGYCRDIAPFRYEIDPFDGKANLIDSTGRNDIYTTKVFSDEFKSVKTAADICPVKIIRIESV